MKILIMLSLFSFNIFALDANISERIQKYETELAALLNDGIERLTTTKGHLALVQISINSAALEKSLIRKPDASVKGILPNLPGIHIELDDISEKQNIQDVSKADISKFITKVNISIQTNHTELLSSPEINQFIKNLVNYYLSNVKETAITIKFDQVNTLPQVPEKPEKKVEEEAKKEEQKPVEAKPEVKGPTMLENFISNQLLISILLLLSISAFLLLTSKLSKKLIQSFAGIENSIKEVGASALDSGPSSMLSDTLNKSEDTTDNYNVDTDLLNEQIGQIEKLATIDFETYKSAFKLYIDLGQVDEAIVLVNLSSKLAQEYQSLFNDIEAQRFKKSLKNRTVEIFDSKQLLIELTQNIIQSIRMAKASPEAMYNYILKHKLTKSLALDDMNFDQFSPDEISKIVELASPEVMANYLCNNKLSVNQIQRSPMDFDSAKAMSLISKISNEEKVDDPEADYQSKLVQVALELPMDLEKSFVKSLGLANDSYPTQFGQDDLELIFKQVRLMSIDDASYFLGCLIDDIRIDIVNKLPEIMAKRLNAKGYQVTTNGRKIKKHIWLQLINLRKGVKNADHSQNRAA